MNAEKNDDTVNLVLEGEVTIYTAQDIKRRLLESLALGQTVEVDLSGVSEFDTAGLQIMLLARAEALRENKNLIYVPRSPAVDEVLNLCQLEQFFDGTPAERIW